LPVSESKSRSTLEGVGIPPFLRKASLARRKIKTFGTRENASKAEGFERRAIRRNGVYAAGSFAARSNGI
jgi:hypothetical protein